VTPLDVLSVLNYLNRQTLDGPEGEGVAPASGGIPQLIRFGAGAQSVVPAPSPVLGNGKSAIATDPLRPSPSQLFARPTSAPSAVDSALSEMEDILTDIAADVRHGWESGDALA
jgi:hypothetical protein